MYNYGWGVQKDVEQAMKYYTMAGESGDIYSQFMYVNLMLGNQDYPQPEAQQNTSRDIPSGMSTDAYFDLGMMYYGRNNYAEAFAYFYRSAQLGHAGAANMIGHMFEYGQGRDKNLASARSWYQEAANRGHDGAKKALERLTEKNQIHGGELSL